MHTKSPGPESRDGVPQVQSQCKFPNAPDQKWIAPGMDGALAIVAEDNAARAAIADAALQQQHLLVQQLQDLVPSRLEIFFCMPFGYTNRTHGDVVVPG